MRSASYVPDGSQVITAQADGTVAFWDVVSGAQIGKCCAHLADGGGQWGAFSAEVVPEHADRAIVSYDDYSIHVWDITEGTGTDVHGFAGPFLGFAISPDGETLVLVSQDETSAWHADWDANTFEEMRTWPSNLASSLDFSPDGRWIVWGGLDGVVRILDVATGTEITEGGDKEFRVANGAATAVAFSADGAWVLAGQADGTIRIWDVATARLLAELPVHAGPIAQIDTFADGRIATASDDESARVFTCEICGKSTDQVVEAARAQAAIYDPKPND
jgi:WD40 repeat protein